MNKRRLVWNLYTSLLLIGLLSVGGMGVLALHFVSKFHMSRQQEELRDLTRVIEPLLRAQLAPPAAPGRADALCRQLAQGAESRVTLILPSGVVIGDSDEASAQMPNHGDRPEVKAALAGEIRPKIRPSSTVGQTLYYLAAPITEGGRVIGAVRLARSMAVIHRDFLPVRRALLMLMIGMALLVAALCYVMARRIGGAVHKIELMARQYARGDFSSRLYLDGGSGLAGLASSMNEMAEQLATRIREITRERNEREAILASMREGVLALDHEERILMINRAAESLLGLEAGAAIGRLVQEALRHAELQRFLARVRSGAELLSEDNVLRWSQDRLLQVESVPLRDEDRRERGLLIVLNDVTRLHRLENLRREFVANVSHELRTPITSIKGFVETLRDGAIGDPENAERFLEIIARQADRLNAIIEDLLTLSRVERDEEQRGLEMKPFALAPMLRTVTQHFAPRAAEKRVELAIDCPEELGVRGNERLLEQAVGNLIDNALKFSEAGTRIEVAARAEEQDVLLEVADQGCGIPAQHLPRLFERFYRVDTARSRQLGGTGLGLAIVKHIVQAHGGFVTVQSKPGHGSRFMIHLPRPEGSVS